jgi:hypothetical protein
MELLTLREAAQVLHSTPKTVLYRIKKGMYPRIKIGHTLRIPKSCLWQQGRTWKSKRPDSPEENS